METKLGDLSCVKVTNPSTSASVSVCLFGGTIYSFISSDGKENLFLSSKAVTDGSKPLRGGIPIIFPQFGSGKLTKHGFARRSEWSFDKDSVDHSPVSSSFSLSLVSNAETRKQWDFEFGLKLKIYFTDNCLSTDLIVTNTGSSDFKFQALLHTYIKLNDIKKVIIKNLEDSEFIDQLKPIGEKLNVQKGDIVINEEVDRIYTTKQEKPQIVEIVVDEAESKIVRIKRQLMEGDDQRKCDVVVWNPWVAKSKAMSDFDDEEFNSMLW